MNPRAIRAIMAKDLRDILKNRTTLLGLLSPIFITLLYLLIGAVSNTAEPTRIYAYNPGNVAITQTLGLGPDAPVQIVLAPNAEAVAAELSKNETDYRYGVVLPQNVADDIRAGRQPKAELYINGAKVDDAIRRTQVQSSFYAYLAQFAPQPFALTYKATNIKEDENNSILGKLFGGTKGLAGFYAGFALALTPILLGLQVLPVTLVEEKEKRTLRMLLTSPASPLDVVVAKGLLGVGYTLLISAIVIAINWAYYDNILLVVTFAVLSALFACGLGVVLGAIFNTAQSLNSWAGLLIMLFLIPGLVSIFQPTGIVNILIHLVPTYYLFSGTLGATAGTLDFQSATVNLLVGVVLVVAVYVLAAVILRRRALNP